MNGGRIGARTVNGTEQWQETARTATCEPTGPARQTSTAHGRPPGGWNQLARTVSPRGVESQGPMPRICGNVRVLLTAGWSGAVPDDVDRGDERRRNRVGTTRAAVIDPVAVVELASDLAPAAQSPSPPIRARDVGVDRGAAAGAPKPPDVIVFGAIAVRPLVGAHREGGRSRQRYRDAAAASTRAPSTGDVAQTERVGMEVIERAVSLARHREHSRGELAPH